MSVAVDAVTVTLEAKPVKPSAPLVLSRKDYDALVSPMDLKLGEKYRAGQLLSRKGWSTGSGTTCRSTAPASPWAGTSPHLRDTVELIVPADTKNGNDTLIVSDSHGREVAFARFHVTPKGI